MALKIEKGGWILIFLIGLGLVGYSLNKYGVLNIGKFLSKPGSSTAKVDPAAAAGVGPERAALPEDAGLIDQNGGQVWPGIQRVAVAVGVSQGVPGSQ